MLRFIVLVMAIWLSPQLLAEEQVAQEEPRFLSNNVFTYLHGGPGTKYRILGSVEAGRPITFLGEKQDGYSKIRDHKGRTGWVSSKLVTANKTFRVRVTELEAQLKELNTVVSQHDEQTAALTKDIKDKAKRLERELSSQTAKVQQLQKDYDQALVDKNAAVAELKAVKDNQQFTLWREGGIIAGIGALVGIILVYLPRPGRKKSRMF